MTPERLPHLDGWRAIAVLLVVFGHLLHLDAAARLLDPSTVSRLGRYAFVGVDIFFVISGFVITRSLLREHERGGVRLSGFYARRACRILPPLFLYLAAVTALAALGVIANDGRDTVAALLFLCNTAANCGWHTGHIWSLSYEEQFYAAFPPLLLFALGGRLHWAAIPAVLFALVPLVAPAQWLGRASFVQTHALLLAGVVAAFLPVRRVHFGWTALAALVILAAPQVGGWTGRMLALFAMPSAICVLLLCSGPQRLLTLSPIVYVGRISYSIYLWQQLGLSNDLPLDPMQRALALAGVFAIAAASFAWIEAPFQKLAREFSSRLRRPADEPRPLKAAGE